MSQLIKAFDVPRARVVLEVTRAFQAIQVSLKRLDEAVRDLRSAQRDDGADDQEATEPEIFYSSTFGDTE